jgi:DNA recombination protein RmuC
MPESAILIFSVIAVVAFVFIAFAFSNLRRSVDELRGVLDKSVSEVGPQLRREFGELRKEEETRNGQLRIEVTTLFTKFGETMSKSLEGITALQHTRLSDVSTRIESLTTATREELGQIRVDLNRQVNELRTSNEKKLDEMRKTVDEQLQSTLEKRLGESFQLVSQNLEAVQRGLGEMQNLATGVGDLKRVLTNVKARGTWAETQLASLLEQILTQTQYQANVCVKPDSNEIVEFAVKLPGRNNEDREFIWLPIDSKFPQEDYLRLQEAADRADTEAVKLASDALARSIRNSAKEIAEKYIAPPHSTDFAIMFLATEGLYSEVLRYPGLVDEVRRNHNVIIAGPTTFSAILCSLSFGFQTLAIEQRASEVWKLLSAVKTEFRKFGDVLDKVKKQLDTASKSIDETGRRSRAIERKLRNVEELPETQNEERLLLDIVENIDPNGYVDD